MKLPIRPEAVTELDAAMAFHEGERPGLGLDLLDAIENAVEFASENPDAGERRAVGSGYDIRRFVVKGFPYLVYIASVAGRREIVAVAHASRRPGYWADRLD